MHNSCIYACFMHIYMTYAYMHDPQKPVGQARVKTLTLTRPGGPRFLARPEPSAGRVKGTAGST